MKQPRTIVAGAFTIEPSTQDTIDSVGGLLSQAYADIGGADVHPLDLRTLYPGGDQTHPPLFAVALPLPTGTVWVIRGVEDVAQIKVKDKFAKNPEKLDRPLISWAESFSQEAAYGLAAQAYRGLTDDENLDAEEADDGSIHVTIELPLDGIDAHRDAEADFDEWLDALSDVAEAALERVDAEPEVILFDASEEGRPSLAGHISVVADDDDDAVNLVREAMIEAFAPFTPSDEVRDRLNVEIEEMCLYSMLNGLMGGLGDEDLGD